MDREVETGVEVLSDLSRDDTRRLRTSVSSRDSNRVGLAQSAAGSGRPEAVDPEPEYEHAHKAADEKDPFSFRHGRPSVSSTRGAC